MMGKARNLANSFVTIEVTLGALLWDNVDHVSVLALITQQ